MPKRLIAFILFATLVGASVNDLRAQWVKDTFLNSNDGSWAMVTLSDTIYISSHGTIFALNKQSESWVEYDNGLLPNYAYLHFMGCRNLFLAEVSGIGFPDDTNYGKLFRSTDAGSSWNRVNISPFSIGNGALTAIGYNFYV